MMNLTRMIRKAPLPSGVFTFRGVQGVGKSSCVTALLCLDYKFHRKWRTEQARALADQFRMVNHVPLRIADHLYFSNVPILLSKRRGIRTHYIDVSRLGLPNEDFPVQYLPRGSVIFIEEADLELNCRDWDSLNAYLVALLKFVRHNLLTVIFDCQADGALDKAVRRLTVGVYHIMESYTKRFFLFWKPRTWNFIYIRNQENEMMKELASVGVKLGISVVERGRLRFFGNIFERFDSFSGARYFLKGIENVGYEYLSHPMPTLQLEDIYAYCEMHPLVKPDATRRRRGRRGGREGQNSDV